ncbi:MAG: archaetidylserine decarboxylase [Vicinamibacteraceae bacterium]
MRAAVGRDGVNYLVTNHIPRRLATRLMGWFSRVEQPLVARLSLAIWRAAAGDALRLDEADRTEFRSIHDCFTRALKPGARPIDSRAGIVVSPCDGVVVAAGRIADATLVQAKGFIYTLDDLLQDRELVSRCRDGHYVTIRLTSTMYHRFHAPGDGCVTTVCHVPGDLWNVNPPALARVPRLYCRNERVIIPIALVGMPSPLVLVPVGAILVGSVHLHFARLSSRRRYDRTRRVRCQASFRRGEELGYFHHGSTIIVLAPPGLEPVPGVTEGMRLRVGQPLLRHASDAGGVASSSRNAPAT